MTKNNNMISEQALATVEAKTVERFKRALTFAGQINAHNGYSQISEFALVQNFNEVRESKCYKGLPYTDEKGNAVTITSIEQYCSVFLSVSYRVLAEKAQQLITLGEEAYNGATQLGLTRSTLRTIDHLPTDKKETIKLALAAKNKTLVTEILEDVITRNDREAKAKDKRIAELENNVATDAKYIEKINRDKNKLEAKLIRKKTNAWDVRVKEFNIETGTISNEIHESLDRLDTLRDIFLNEDFGEEKDAAYHAMACVYFDAIQRLTGRMGLVAGNCEQTFSGYALEPMPMLEYWEKKGGQE